MAKALISKRLDTGAEQEFNEQKNKLQSMCTLQLYDSGTTEKDGGAQLNRTGISIIVARGENNTWHLEKVPQFFFHPSIFFFVLVSRKQTVETVRRKGRRKAITLVLFRGG